MANEALPPTLTCTAAGYYPLDVTVTWTREEPGRTPVPVSGASFSSLRQSAAGTYTISSSLIAEPGSAGATYTCQVTHISLEEPLEASTWVAPPGTGSTLLFPPLHLGSWFSCPELALALFCFPQHFVHSPGFFFPEVAARATTHTETSLYPRFQVPGSESWRAALSNS